MSNEQYFDTEEEAQEYIAEQEKVPYGRKVFSELFPGHKINSDYRSPDHPLSKKNPKSYHTTTDRAVDVPAIPGMSFDEAADYINSQGYDIIELKDEYKNPSKNATGPHWHFVLGDRKFDPSTEFDTEEEALAYINKMQGAAPEAPAPAPAAQAPKKPLTQNVPTVVNKYEDNYNDRFKAFAFTSVETINLTVFNRWGRIVYQTTDPWFRWDGKNQENNKDCS